MPSFSSFFLQALFLFLSPELEIPFRLPTLPMPYPVRWGFAFEEGQLKTEGELELFERGGNRVPFFSKTVAQWGDGSVRWVWIEFEAEKESYVLRRNFSTQKAVATRVQVSQENERVTIKNEALSLCSDSSGGELFSFECSSSHFYSKAWLEFSEASTSYKLGFGEKAVALTDSSPIRATLKISKSESCIQGPFGWDLRVSLLGSLPLVDIGLRFTNLGNQDLELEDLALCLSLSEALQKVSLVNDSHSSSLTKASLLQMENIDGKGSLKDSYFVQARQNLCFNIPNFSMTWPKGIEFHESGLIKIFILPGKNKIPAGMSVPLKLRLFLPSGGKFNPRAFLPLLEELLLSQPATNTSSQSLGEFSEKLEEGEKKLSAEFQSASGWKDFGDYHLGPTRWGNLEFDTAAGWIKRFLQTGEKENLSLARNALSHWKSIDVLRSRDSPFCFLPAVHAPEHTRGMKVDPGHVWVEGLLLEYALTGNEENREIAIALGDSLVELVTSSRSYKDYERNLAWPLIALRELHSFFPDRGYGKTADALFNDLLSKYQEMRGYFIFDERVDFEEGEFAVNVWQLGGVLLEALNHEAELEPKHRRLLEPKVRKLIEFLLQEAWDSKKKHFVHTLVFDLKTARLLERHGQLKPVHEIYVFSQIARAGELYRNSSWQNFAQKWRASAEHLNWKRKYIGNDFSLLLRALASLP